MFLCQDWVQFVTTHCKSIVCFLQIQNQKKIDSIPVDLNNKFIIPQNFLIHFEYIIE